MDDQLGLFTQKSTDSLPLAAKCRPQSLEQFIGQKSALEKIQRQNLSNPEHTIFHGPPGCGKTTLAQILASNSGLLFSKFNAVLGGVKELRVLIEKAQFEQNASGKKTIIFIDEIHRFNKSQQDALLPYLEDKTFILFGATTENPKTTLNKAILSRISLIRLNALTDDDILKIIQNTATENNFNLPLDVKEFIASHCYGDARFALNQLNILLDNANKLKNLSSKEIIKNYLDINRVYDKDKDRHYDVISAFIKSIRGSDPEAAILWLAVMLEAGEDVEFIARRLIILASEDIGNADPQALNITTSTHYAVSKIGMPEARIPLAQATVYLAMAPKSNSSYMAINQAMNYVKNNPTIDVPTHLRNHHPDKEKYIYPHNYQNHWTPQRYKPENILEKFYQSGTIGFEEKLRQYQKEIRK